MKSKLLHSENGLRMFAVVFSAGESPMEGLQSFARAQQLSAAQITALGAFQSATIAFFDIEKREYEHIPVSEQVEVLSLVGDVTLAPDGGPKVHAHVVLGRRSGATLGGHLMEARVRPTLEVIVTETPRHLHRKHDEATGLALIDP